MSTLSKKSRRTSKELSSLKSFTDAELQSAWGHLARTDLCFFPEYVSDGGWQPAPHLELLADKLQAIAKAVAGRDDSACKRLIIQMPPRHGKSEFSSAHFPTWFMGNWPDLRTILTSYGADLAEGFGRRNRNLMAEWGPQLWGIRVASDSSSQARWDIAGHRGGMTCAGVGGPITGKGGHCFPAGTMVQTEIGPVDIAALARMDNPPRVLSYDHVTNRLVYRKIIASRWKNAHEFTEITTHSWCKTISTREHRFYNYEQGYREAHFLRPGDRLAVLKIAQQQGVRSMWPAQKRAGVNVPEVLPCCTQGRDNSKMLVLRERVQPPALRVREIVKAGMHRFLLLLGVQQITSRYKKQQTVPGMRKAQKRSTPKVLFAGMQKSGTEKKAQAKEMPTMRGRVSAIIKTHCILFQGMCGYCPLCKNEGRWKSPFQRWHKLRQMVQRYAAHYFGARQLPVCWLWGQRGNKRNTLAGPDSAAVKFINSPHRRGYNKQYTRKPCNAVQHLPSEPSQIESDTISTVRNLCSESIPVYDIQVEGTSNFFANGILVHNCCIIDDPFKNAEEANSPTYREKVWDWYRTVLRTRVEPGGAIILIMTRWHEDDLAGRLLQQAEEDPEADQWEVLSLPAIAEENDPLGRQPGQALWPERYNEKDLEKIRKSLGSYWWSALFQQRPQPVEGMLFKREHFRYFTEENGYYVLHRPEGSKRVTKSDCWVFQTVDLAASTKDTADYFVMGTWAVTWDSETLLLDVFRARLEGPDQPKILRQQYNLYRPSYQAIESVAYQLTLVQQGARDGLPVKKISPDKDKISRALVAAARCECGMMYFRHNAPWLSEYEKELLAFPNGANDDQVDITSYAAEEVAAGTPSIRRL